MGEVTCANCGHKMNVELVSTLTPESAMRMTIHPMEGQKLSLDTVGASMSDMSKLLKAIAKEQGLQAEVFLDDLKIDPSGAVSFGFVITRFEKPVGLPSPRKRERRRA